MNSSSEIAVVDSEARPETSVKPIAIKPWHARLINFVVIPGTLLLLWPAVFNGCPLWFPDSIDYLATGQTLWRALFMHKFAGYYGMRSLLYSLAIFPLHMDRTTWPIAVLQCFLAAWVIWLTVRAVKPPCAVRKYMGLIAVLSLLTSLSWFAVFVMPDILGPLAYLCLFLVIFASETLGPIERLTIYPVAIWGIAAHSSHLPIGALLCVFFMAYAAIERKHFWMRMAGVGRAVAILAVAAGAQMALHGYLFGTPTLNHQERPPFFLARVIADGPGRLYLEQHCSFTHWTICRHLNRLTDNSSNFLWAADGAYQSSTIDEQKSIRREEMPLVLATLRAYPWEESEQAAANFWQQLFAFGPYAFRSSKYIVEHLDNTLRSENSSYLCSRQVQNGLQIGVFSLVQEWTVEASLLTIIVLVCRARSRISTRLVALGGTVSCIVLINAAVTGVFSGVDDRYGCRVIWLIPMLAWLLLASRERRKGKR
jgi:hypothetical protein